MSQAQRLQGFIEGHVSLLRRNLAICQRVRACQRSQLIAGRLESVIVAIQALVQKYTILQKDISQNEVYWQEIARDVLQNSANLGHYKVILYASMDLLLDPNDSLFRMMPNVQIIKELLYIYQELDTLLHHLPQLKHIDYLIVNFEAEFKAKYEKANFAILHLHRVRNLLAPIPNSIVAPPLTDMRNIIKKDYFKLNLDKLQISQAIVEVCHLANNEIIMLEINSKGLFLEQKNNKEFLSGILSSWPESLNIGRSLLFAPIRPKDLEIAETNNVSVKLQTTTGNNIILELAPLDSTQWKNYWESCFMHMFGRQNSTSRLFQDINQTNIHAQKFKSKYDKVFANSANQVDGVGIKMVKNVDNFPEPKKVRPTTLLHKSKPLNRSLSSLVLVEQKNPAELKGADACQKGDINGHSLQKLESLSCAKLVELDQSIEMNISPFLSSPLHSEVVKSVSQSSSIEKLPQHYANLSDAESAFSVSDNEIEEEDGYEWNFNPAVNEHHPTLYVSKSSSLLNFFTGKNKKKLTLQATANDTASYFSENSQPSSAKSEHFCITEKESIELPESVNVDSSACLFEDIGRVSVWKESTWERISRDELIISIFRQKGNNAVLVVHKPGNLNACVLVFKIGTYCLCHRSSAQDIQMTIPQASIISSIVSLKKYRLTVRCRQAERLVNIMLHCIKGRLPAPLTASETLQTLSTATTSPSSYMDHSISASSTTLSSTVDIKDENVLKVSLLLPNIKVKHHIRAADGSWTCQSTGMVNIYTKEYEGLRLGVKIVDAIDGTANANKISLQCKIGDINRFGGTGIFFLGSAQEHLLEFQTTAVADKVYHKIIQ